MGNYVGKTPTVLWVHEGIAGVMMVMGSGTAKHVVQNVSKLIFPSRGVVERLWGRPAARPG